MQPGHQRRWAALILLCTAQFLVILDTSIIGIALPAIQKALSMTPSGLQWVFNAYVVAFGGLLLLGGRLADLLGRRAVFMAGFATLTAGSLVAGIAGADTVLLAGRAVQGIGAALIAPAALSLVMQLFTDPKELARAFGFWGGAAAAGGTAGVFLGGVITEWLSWRWTFLVNIPLGLIVLLAAPLVLPAGKRAAGKVDVVGAFTITLALVLGVFALVTGAEAPGRMVGLLVIVAMLVMLFVVSQAKTKQPLIPLSIFRAPNLAAANGVMGLLGAAWIPMWFFLNLHLQEVLGYSALDSGLALVPMTLLIMGLMMFATPRIVARFGFPRVLVAGLVVLAVATAAMALLPPDASFVVHVLPVSLVAAIGMALAFIPANIAGMSGARPEAAGLASGLVNTSYQVGSALGLAAMVGLSTATTSAASAFVGAGVIALGAAVLAARHIRAPG